MSTDGQKRSNGGMTMSIIGCGTMGSAILQGVLSASSRSEAAEEEPKIAHFIATVQSSSSAEKLRTRFSSCLSRLEVIEKDNVGAMQRADIILLACKPYMAQTVLAAPGVREALEGKLVISVLVGSPVEKLEGFIFHPGRTLGEHIYIKRAMLNIAAEFGESMTVIETSPMPAEFEEISNWIFSQVGEIAPVAPDLFDIGGVLAGPSSAFLSVALDGMLDGAVKEGLKRADAKKILTQSLLSLAKLLEMGEHPAVLRERYSSPRGTTIEGLQSLEEDRVRYAFSKAVIASSKRSQEIGK